MDSKFSINQIEQLLNSTKSRSLNLTVCTINYLLEDRKNENMIISFINKTLKSSRNEETYMYLNKIISCISTEVLHENILYWIQCIVEHNNNEINIHRHTLISNLIQMGKTNQDFNKIMFSSLLFKIIEECLSSNIEDPHVIYTLRCLATCLEVYASSCGSLKNKIESYLLQFINTKTENLKIIRNAALCFQKLQTIGNPGIGSINHKDNWKNSFEKLCVTMDVLYDSFFDDVDEFHNYEKLDLDPYILPELPKVISSTEVLYILENRLQNICIFLRGMLEYEFSHPKCIYPQYVVDILTRVVSLHICITSKSDSSSTFHFSMLLLKHQVTILYFLRSLIAVLGLNCLPFSATISKLLIDCLARTRNCNCFKHIGEYTETLYKVLEYWIKILGDCLNVNVHDNMVNLIINDISPITTDVSLNISSITDISGKARKKAVQEKIISSSMKQSSLENYAKNVLKTREKTCYQALCCLSTLMSKVNVILKDNTFALMYKVLTEAILSIHNGKKIFPYNTDNVKLKLFETLLATLECSKPPPSIGLIVNLLKEGQRNSNISISHTCSLSLNVLEKICQPVCPSLNFNYQNVSHSNSDEVTIELSEDVTHSDETPLSQEIFQEMEQVEVSTENLMECSDVDTLNENTLEAGNAQCSSEIITKDDSNANDDVETQSKEQDASVEDKREENIITEKLILNQEQNKQNNGNGQSIKKNNGMGDTELKVIKDDCVEPLHKKLKMENPDINEMLASFVDEISDNIDNDK